MLNYWPNKKVADLPPQQWKIIEGYFYLVQQIQVVGLLMLSDLESLCHKANFQPCILKRIFHGVNQLETMQSVQKLLPME